MAWTTAGRWDRRGRWRSMTAPAGSRSHPEPPKSSRSWPAGTPATVSPADLAAYLTALLTGPGPRWRRGRSRSTRAARAAMRGTAGWGVRKGRSRSTTGPTSRPRMEELRRDRGRGEVPDGRRQRLDDAGLDRQLGAGRGRADRFQPRGDRR